MLKISTHSGETPMIMTLEGKLAGSWVEELERCWLTIMTADLHPPIVVDLAEVSFIDAAGKELLTRMYRRGARLVAVDCLTRSLVEEIEHDQEDRRGSMMSVEAPDKSPDVGDPPETGQEG